jgi:hypothetical protein
VRETEVIDMPNIITVDAQFIDSQTLHLFEPMIGRSNKKIKVIIEQENPQVKSRIFGCANEWIEITPDFNEPLEDLKEYME